MKNNLFTFAMLALLAFGLTLTACGPSKAVLAIQQTATIEEVQGLTEKLTWLEANAQSGGSYVIELDCDDAVNIMVRGGSFLEGSAGVFSNKGDLYYKDKKDITITLKSVDTNRTIDLDKSFGVGSGVTLILDNITLKGRDKIVYNGPNNPEPHGALVYVSSDGTLVMNDGSAIIDNISNSGYGGGVYVSGGGTFIMKGGVIQGNANIHELTEARYIEGERLAAAQRQALIKGKLGGTSDLKYNDRLPVFGGGVYVSGSRSSGLLREAEQSATFIKTGGTITGYASDTQKGNRAMDAAGKTINGNGHAIYFEGKEPKAFDNTVGPEITLEFKDDVLKEGRAEGASAPVAPAAAPAVQVTEEAVSQQHTVPVDATTPVVQQETVPAVQQQAAPVTPQEALQEYQATAQKIKEKQQAAVLEYQTTVQQNPAAQQEAAQRYQKTLQETQQEMQEVLKKYQEAMQKR